MNDDEPARDAPRTDAPTPDARGVADAEAGERDHVRALARGIAVIKAFGPETPELTLSEVARATGLTRAAARRFLLTLEDLGYVRCDGRLFRLTPRVLELGYAYLSGMPLPEIARPHLERLSATTGESSSMSVLDDTDIVYVARSAASRIMAIRIDVGTRLPAFATSMGQVLLAALDEADLDAFLRAAVLDAHTTHTATSAAELRGRLDAVRRQGWAVVDQELELGLRSIAAPVRDPRGAVLAAVNVATHAGRTTLDALRRRLLPELLAVRDAIEADLGHGRYPTSAQARARH
jgi:IclR family pca regulon transcriptional regulator